MLVMTVAHSAATVCVTRVGAYVVLLIALAFSRLRFACNVHAIKDRNCPLAIKDRNRPLGVRWLRECWALQPTDSLEYGSLWGL